jgi:DnaK suppressor protein
MDTEFAPHEAQDESVGEVEEGAPPVAGADTQPLERSSEASIDAVDGVLDEVERALTRLDDGTYGICESCGSAIEDRRLAESPTVLSCAGCLQADARPAPESAPG